MAALRERYGFTAFESLDMAIAEFEEWLEALVEDKDPSTSEEYEDGEVWEAMNGKPAG